MMMFLLTATTTSSVFVVLAYFQKDYVVKYERYTNLYVNDAYFKDYNISYDHFNRTTRILTCNTTLTKSLSNHLKFKFQTYKLLSNEYRYFPVFYEDNPCVAMALDPFGNSITHFDTNVHKCPLQAGFYYLKNVTLDQSRFPPHAPRGQFMFDVEIAERQVALLKVKVYIKVVATDPLEIRP